MTGRLDDLFTIQTDVAENIAAALQVGLSTEERARLGKNDLPKTQSLMTFTCEDWLFGSCDIKMTTTRLSASSSKLCSKTPRFALADVGLANAYIDRPMRFGGERQMAGFSRWTLPTGDRH